MLGDRSFSTLLGGRIARYALVLSALILVWVAIVADAASANTRSVTVMTQNLYQGTEFAHIQALVGKVGLTEKEIVEATTADYGTYLATRFKDRAKQIAAEIAQNGPA